MGDNYMYASLVIKQSPKSILRYSRNYCYHKILQHLWNIKTIVIRNIEDKCTNVKSFYICQSFPG